MQGWEENQEGSYCANEAQDFQLSISSAQEKRKLPHSFSLGEALSAAERLIINLQGLLLDALGKLLLDQQDCRICSIWATPSSLKGCIWSQQSQAKCHTELRPLLPGAGRYNVNHIRPRAATVSGSAEQPDPGCAQCHWKHCLM